MKYMYNTVQIKKKQKKFYWSFIIIIRHVSSTLIDINDY